MRFILFVFISFFSISVYSQAVQPPTPKPPYPFNPVRPQMVDVIDKVLIDKNYEAVRIKDSTTGKVTNRATIVNNANKISNATRSYLRSFVGAGSTFLAVFTVMEVVQAYLDADKTIEITAKPSGLYDVTGSAFGTIPIDDLPEQPGTWLEIANDLYPDQEKYYKLRSGQDYVVRLARSLTTPCGGAGEPGCQARNFPKHWNESFTEPLDGVPSGDVNYWGEMYSRVIDGARQQIFSFVSRTGQLEPPAITYEDITEEQVIGAIPETSLDKHLDDDLIADLANRIYEDARAQDPTLPEIEPVTREDVGRWRDKEKRIDPNAEPLTVRDLLRRILNELGVLPDFNPEPYVDDIIREDEAAPIPPDFEWMCGIDGAPDCAVNVDDSGFSDVDDPLADSDTLLDDYVDNVLDGLPECVGEDCEESNPWGFSMSPFMPDLTPFVGACQNPEISIFDTPLDVDLCGLAEDVKPVVNFLFYFYMLFSFRRLFLAISSN